MYIGQILLPMTRFVLVLNNQFCPTPLIAIVFPFLVVSAALTDRIITGSPFWALLSNGHSKVDQLRTILIDLRPLNLGLATAKWHAQDRLAWWLLVTTAPLMTGSQMSE